MDIQHLKPLLSQGETEQVIGRLLQLSATYHLPSGNEIVLLSSRFHIVTKEKMAAVSASILINWKLTRSTLPFTLLLMSSIH
ncbi:hypothetical protein [Niabella hibiscisoli]|uniref:hypothetical protein n=1 Tax=Niabella hibiscisoli TaxID=1825928 RepID=UPI00374D971A